jgi:hypothetical protein
MLFVSYETALKVPAAAAPAAHHCKQQLALAEDTAYAVLTCSCQLQ